MSCQPNIHEAPHHDHARQCLVMPSDAYMVQGSEKKKVSTREEGQEVGAHPCMPMRSPLSGHCPRQPAPKSGNMTSMTSPLWFLCLTALAFFTRAERRAMLGRQQGTFKPVARGRGDRWACASSA